jgi:hypothetical protein
MLVELPSEGRAQASDAHRANSKDSDMLVDLSVPALE